MEKQEEKTLNLATLVFPVRDGEVLLAEKMRNIGKGCINGWGGGVEPDESLRECAVREFFEETGGAKVKPEDLVKMGIVHFKNHKSDGSIFVCTVHIYFTTRWEGEIVSTEEMDNPKWYSFHSVGQENLMLADPFWLPRMLFGEKGIAWAEYGPYQQTLLSDVRFEPVDSFEEE
jgi:8-oxo-dGTP diphosphatase